MQSSVDISVIIVNWNTRDLLLECVESLLEETRSASLEIIVVDNASTDGSVVALSQRHPGVRQIRNTQNLGFSRANNQGLAIAQGRYLCLVNSDVKALDRVLDKMMAYLDSHPEIGALAPRTVGADLRLRRNCREYPTLRNEANQALFLDRLFPGIPFFRGRTLTDYDYSTPSDIEVLSCCFLMVPRAVWESVGGLDERFFIYAEDVDWSKRIREAGWRVVFYPDAEAIHYGGSSAAVERSRFSRELLKANLQYWRKHHGGLRTGIYWTLQLVGGSARAVGWSIVWLLRGRRHDRARQEAEAHWQTLRWLLGSSYPFARA